MKKLKPQRIISTLLVLVAILISMQTSAHKSVYLKYKLTSDELEPGSKVFLTFTATDGKADVDGDDAIGMLKTYIEGKTTCVVVNTLDEADFVIELSVVKKAMSNRSAMILIKQKNTDKEIFKSKWVVGASTAFYGYSGTRAAIGRLVKSDLLKRFPKIEKKE